MLFTVGGIVTLGGCLDRSGTDDESDDETLRTTDPREVTVGFAEGTSREITDEFAVDVLAEYDFGAVTIEVDANERDALAEHDAVTYVEENHPVAAIDDELLVEYTVGFDGRSGYDRVTDVAVGEVRELNHLDAVTTTIRRREAEELEGRSDVEYVTPNSVLSVPHGDSAVSINAGALAAIGRSNDDELPTGDGVRVAVLDTGVSPDHPDLGSNLDAGTAFVNGTIEAGPDATADDYGDLGNGTRLATSIAADGSGAVDGVTPDATVVPIKVADAAGVGRPVGIAAGIEHAVHSRCDVVLLGFTLDEGTDVVADALSYAASADVSLVAGVGDRGPRSEPTFPAAHPDVIGVGALASPPDPHEVPGPSDGVAAFSARGDHVDLLAPGERVPQATRDGGVVRMSDTNTAAALVAGAIASVRSTGATAEEGREALVGTARDIGVDDDTQGAGLIALDAALELAG